MSMQIRIVTPTGEVLDTVSDRLTASGLLGEFGILPGHIPFLTALKVGAMQHTYKGLTEAYALGEGFAEVFKDSVTFFVETAEKSEEIDMKRAQLALDKAEKALKEQKHKNPEDPEKMKVENAHRRAATRIKVAKFKQ